MNKKSKGNNQLQSRTTKDLAHKIKSTNLTGTANTQRLPVTIKAFIVEGTDGEIAKLVGLQHVNEAQAWERIGKAGQVVYLIDEKLETFDSLSQDWGMPKPILKQIYFAFHQSTFYGKKYGIDNYKTIFAIFDEVARQSRLMKLLETDPSKEEWLMNLIHDGKITQGKMARKLAKIASFKNPDRVDALKELDSKNGNIESALKCMKNKPRKNTWEQVNDALTTLLNIPHREIVAASTNNANTKLFADIASVVAGYLHDIQKMQRTGTGQN